MPHLLIPWLRLWLGVVSTITATQRRAALEADGVLALYEAGHLSPKEPRP